MRVRRIAATGERTRASEVEREYHHVGESGKRNVVRAALSQPHQPSVRNHRAPTRCRIVQTSQSCQNASRTAPMPSRASAILTREELLTLRLT